jgi:predicted small lipoprotein YifL
LGFVLKRVNNLTSIFHKVIIAIFLLSLGACGYKAAPYYQKEAPQSDENVEFILEKKSFENNESCN